MRDFKYNGNRVVLGFMADGENAAQINLPVNYKFVDGDISNILDLCKHNYPDFKITSMWVNKGDPFEGNYTHKKVWEQE